MLTNINQLTQSHGVRTFFAGLAGTLAVYLLLTGITSVWLMRTLTDTPTFVQTVAPLATKPAIQKFVAKTVAESHGGFLSVQSEVGQGSVFTMVLPLQSPN